MNLTYTVIASPTKEGVAIFIIILNVYTKKSPGFLRGSFLKSATTYSPTIAVPSALSGLTSLFGMGRGGTPTL